MDPPSRWSFQGPLISFPFPPYAENTLDSTLITLMTKRFVKTCSSFDSTKVSSVDSEGPDQLVNVSQCGRIVSFMQLVGFDNIDGAFGEAKPGEIADGGETEDLKPPEERKLQPRRCQCCCDTQTIPHPANREQRKHRQSNSTNWTLRDTNGK